MNKKQRTYIRKYMRLWRMVRRSHYNFQHRAHNAVYYALKKKKIKKSPCEICGTKKAEAHHKNHWKKLDVHWLCRKHHKQEHKGQKKLDLIKQMNKIRNISKT